MSRKTNLNSEVTAVKSKFPIVWLLLILLSFTVLIYSAVSVVIFYTSIDSATATNVDIETDAEEGASTAGNMQFTTKEVFNIDDPQSGGATVLLFVFCTLVFASLAVLFFAYKGIGKRNIGRAVKALSLIVATLLGLFLGAFVTYELYQVQLDAFKEEKDISQGETNDSNVDKNGNYYILDGNGVPYLALVIDDEDLSNDKYSKASSALGLSNIDSLYVNCDYDDTNEIYIKAFSIETDAGERININLICRGKDANGEIHYMLSAGGTKILYKLVMSGEVERSDPDAMTTFLVVGKDRVGLNTDVMILVALHDDGKKYSADILQIPRDTFCRDNSSNNKINAVYGGFYNASDATTTPGRIIDGMEGLVSVLERNLLIKIDYWAIMDLDGFGKIVDGINGVDMYVPFDMQYYDTSAVPPLRINLKEGQQTLNGDTAEQFIRYRKGYVTGDLGRVDATKLFLTSFFVKLREELSITNPTALANTVTTLMNYMTTDMDAGNAVSNVKKVLKLNLEDINFLTLPGSDWAKNTGSKLSYYTANRDGLYYIVNNYFNVYDTDINKEEFDASRMFTTASSNTDINRAHNAYFDVEAYISDVEGADQIKEDNDNGENNLPVG